MTKDGNLNKHQYLNEGFWEIKLFVNQAVE